MTVTPRKRLDAPQLFLATLVLTTGALVPATCHLIDSGRNELLNAFSAEQLTQLQKLTREVEVDLHDVEDSLDLMARLMATEPDPQGRERILLGLLGSAKAYHAAAVFDREGRPTLTVKHPQLPDAVSLESEETMARSARKAVLPEGPDVAVSKPVQRDSNDWYRAFAAAVPVSSGRRPQQAVVLLVDTRPFFENLKAIATEEHTYLGVLGPHGSIAPVSSPQFVQFLRDLTQNEDASPEIKMVAQRIGDQGTAVLHKSDAVKLGFPNAGLVLAFAPIAIEGGASWQAISVSSTITLQSREAAISRRLLASTGAIGLLLLGFAAYIFWTSRRAAILGERIKNATELAHLREKAEKTLDSIPTCIMSVSKNFCVAGLNQAMRTRLPTALWGRRVDQSFPNADAASVEKIVSLLTDSASSRDSKTLLNEQLNLFGEDGIFAIHAVPFEHSFADVDTVLVIDDLSEIRQLESQLLRTEKLSTVGTLAAGIAHEIGTPLGVVRGRAEYIAAKIGTNHPQASGLRIIAEQVDKIAKTIRLLLDFSRAKPTNSIPVDLQAAIGNVIDLLEYETERRRIAVNLRLPEYTPLVSADPDQLQQVFVNLMLNAMDACESGGTVTISVDTSTSPAEITPEVLNIVIEDTGSGITPENLVRVFDPFFTTKKRGQGTGLGLTIVSQIVSNHGARIDLETGEPSGAKVTLRWPIAAPQEGLP